MVKKVLCITTCEVFECARDADVKYSISRGSVSTCCRGGQKTAGKHPITNEGLRWMYYDDYIKQLNETKLIHN